MLDILSRLVIKIIDWLHQFNVWVCFPALILILLCDIGLRTFANTSLSWSHEILGLFLLTLFVLWMPYCVVRGDLLQANFLRRYNQAAPTQDRFSGTLIAVCGLFFCWQGFHAVIDMLHYEDRLHTLAIPHWPFALLVFLSGLLILLHKLLTLRKPSEHSANLHEFDT